MKYWIGVVNRDHVTRGVEQGIMQLGHGRKAPLARLHKGDWLVYYSPRQSLDSVQSLQAFTALGQVADEEIYRYHVSDSFNPYRRRVEYQKVNDTPIRPLIESLDFIKSKQSWGYVFRFGLVEIQKDDFLLIKKHMTL
jgi:predicted RNA-binding protein